MNTNGGLPYESGNILNDTQDHLTKLAEAWRHIRQRRGANAPLHNLSGLERGLPMPAGTDEWLRDDEWAAALYTEPLRDLGLSHLGGDPQRHDVAFTNRLTAALFVAAQVTVDPGSTVIGVSPSYSHPAVRRAVRDAGGTLVETVGVKEFETELAKHDKVSAVFLTRLAVTYDALPEEDLHEVVRLAHERDAYVIVDDAGGARVGPAILGQPTSLELGADLGATGLDKYGVTGPRVGLLGGKTELVAAARARAFELGSECRPVLYPAVAACLSQYRHGRVVELVESTRVVGKELRAKLGAWVEDTPFITRLPGEAIAAELLRRNPRRVELAAVEATAAVAMCLLRDHGMLTVHFAGLPPGTAALLVKFLPPETVEAIGGAEVFASAVDDALDKAAAAAGDPQTLRELVLGTSG